MASASANLIKTFPTKTKVKNVNTKQLSQSLTMKSSAVFLSGSLNLSSPLQSIRNKRDSVEPVSIFDLKNMDSQPIEDSVLKEMEERTRSRLSAYGNIESPDIDDLSKSYHSISYCPPHNNSQQHSPAHHSMNASWQFYNFVGEEQTSVDTSLNNGIKKPSQAILTINARTSLILVANETACSMFGYQEEELCNGMKMSQLFTMNDGIKQSVLIEQNIDKDGNVVMASGKVLEAVDSKGNIFVVSVWMKRIQAGKDSRCIVIMEPVEVTRASFLFNAEGTIEDCDFPFAFLHGYECSQDIVGQNIVTIMPALTLPTPGESLAHDVRKQRVTSRTKDMVPFPSTVKIKLHDPEFHQLYLERTPPSRLLPSKFLYKASVWVFANVSGLVTISNDGLVTSCNDNFLRVFLGYIEKEILNEEITRLVPYFYEQINMLCDESLQARFTEHGEDNRKGFQQQQTKSVSRDNSNLSELTIEESEGNEVQRSITGEQDNDSGIEVRANTSGLKNESGEISKNLIKSATTSSHSDAVCDSQNDVIRAVCDSQNGIDNENPKDNVVFTPGSLKKACIENTNLIKIESLDGFSPHTGSSSTPKSNTTKRSPRFEQNTTERTKKDSKSDLENEFIPEKNQLEFDNVGCEGEQTETGCQIPKEGSLGCGTGKNIACDVEKYARGSQSVVTEEGSKTDMRNNTEYDKGHEPDCDKTKNHENKGQQKVAKTSDYESSGSVVEDNSCGSAMAGADTNSKNLENTVFDKDSNNTSANCPNIIVPGNYYGQARHKDGSMLPILFEIKSFSGKDGRKMFAVWISRDFDEECEPNTTSSKEYQRQLLASFNTTVNTSTGNFQEMLKDMQDLKLDDPGRGPYNDKYANIKCIGKGAFGFVNLAERKSNKEQVVVKFIRKEKVLREGWIDDPDMGRVPYEVYLLSKLEHVNIVQMLEAYENDDFFQVVMEKHGEGIDLFEFIDRKPSLDEALCSYMYRQVLAATEYLHQNKVLHRDIKDENIIVDHCFNMKLIDFGSAARMEKGKLFNTFCGTMEYCSPEVLLGNWYEGPELEMWSLGVTLYTLVFGEHPFFEVEETIRAELYPPFRVSNELMFAICWMLHPEVEFRAKLSDVITYPWFTRTVDITQYDYGKVLSGGDHIRNDKDTGAEESNSSPHKLPTQKKTRKKTKTSSSASSDSSLSSSSSLFSTESDDDTCSVDSELEQNQKLLKEEYQKCLQDTRTIKNNVLSNSF